MALICLIKRFYIQHTQTILFSFLTLFRMDFFGAAHEWGGEAPRPQNLSHISYNDETCHSYTLHKEDPKNI